MHAIKGGFDKGDGVGMCFDFIFEGVGNRRGRGVDWEKGVDVGSRGRRLERKNSERRDISI